MIRADNGESESGRAAMGATQITFATFRGLDERKLDSWCLAANTVRAAHEVASVLDAYERATIDATYWRLHALNSRELGRSVRLYSGREQAFAHVAEIRDRRDELVAHAYPYSAARRTIGWYLTLDAEPVVMSARSYESAKVAMRVASATPDLMVNLTERCF
ncbi:hypothetical protein FHX48_001845 [Microbacterium halimionae]|uniref:Uncharacterized protein n=1 Tax=Microbacterium halimionae TaxID=1526413 RepID=A0A7W3JPP3_9MICO|nr:hypothetical protein [Microbacterium halimionae]MBA8816752.1 hypothetical protein [Microbacterium halimionae]NII94952.1 hypothetical protein [Microbacterium halimionae]